MPWRVLALLVALCCCPFQTAWAHPQVFLLMNIQEALPDDPKQPGFQLIKGMDRTKAHVQFGIPLPNDVSAFDAKQILFVGSDDVQYTVLRRWDSNRLQWILIDALLDVKANELRTDTIVTSGESTQGAPMAKEEGDLLKIDTGPAQYWISKKRFNLFEKVVVDNKEMVSQGASSGAILVDNEGKAFRADADTQPRVIIELNGPIRTVIRAQGTHVSSDGKQLLDYTVRMHFIKTKKRVRVLYTLRNASKRLLANVRFKSLSLQVKSNFKGASYVVRHHEGETKGSFAAGETKVTLFQGETTYPVTRDAAATQAFAPTGISGYTIKKDGATLKSGTKEQYIQEFYAQLRAQDGRSVMVGTRFAAGLWPQSLTLAADGTATIGIFPRENDKPFAIRFGSHLTREVVFSFDSKESEPRTPFFKFQYPVVGRPGFVDWFNQDQMFFVRVLSFKEEAAYYKGNGWPVDDRPDATLNRKAAFAIPHYLDWRQSIPTRQTSPAWLATWNYLRDESINAGAYYLLAEQLNAYNADLSVQHSDDYRNTRVTSEVPGLVDAQGKIKDWRQLPGADWFPPAPVRWTRPNDHSYSLGLWHYITGDQRAAIAYYDWGELVQRQPLTDQSATIFGSTLYNLVRLFRFTRQIEYQSLVWGAIQTQSMTRTENLDGSKGTSWTRGYFLGAPQAQSTDKQVTGLGQGRWMLSAYAAFHELGVKNKEQASAARSLVEGVARFVKDELWVAYDKTPGDFGVPATYPTATAPSQDLRKQADWAGGIQDVYMALYFGYIMTSEFDFLQKAEDLLRATAFNPAKSLWFQDLPGRHMLQYLVENQPLFVIWRPLPIKAVKAGPGKYRLTWLAPYGAREYWFKYADKTIVPSLGFNKETRQYKHDPKTHTPFFAATYLNKEVEPVDPGFYQEIEVSGLPDDTPLFFAARYYTSDPRPPITEPFEPVVGGEPSVDAGEPTKLADAGVPEPVTTEPTGTDQAAPGPEPQPPGTGCGCIGQSSPGLPGGLWLVLFCFVMITKPRWRR